MQLWFIFYRLAGNLFASILKLKLVTTVLQAEFVKKQRKGVVVKNLLCVILPSEI